MQAQGGKGETLIVIRHGFRLNYIKPCMTDRQKRMAEVILNNGRMDPYRMCDTLSKAFDNVRCSPEIGVARIKIGDMNIMVFDSGRIVIRQAADDAGIIQIAEKIAALLSCDYK
ncbi:MAG: hypothetical protein HYX24_00015 [Candidatus Aenigmarchaeota archaeon]|nr:hypothetical protein [Candidatus Aenigmarchaeota archaeon]